MAGEEGIDDVLLHRYRHEATGMEAVVLAVTLHPGARATFTLDRPFSKRGHDRYGRADWPARRFLKEWELID